MQDKSKQGSLRPESLKAHYFHTKFQFQQIKVKSEVLLGAKGRRIGVENSGIVSS